MPPDALDSLDETLKPLVLQIVAQNAALLSRIDELLAQQKALLARIAELEAAAGKPPKTRPRPVQLLAAAIERAQGQRRAAHTEEAAQGPARRRARAVPDPDATRDIYAERCACGTAVSPDDQTLAHAYDHIDLPPIKPVTTRINLHRSVLPVLQAARHGASARRHAAGQSVRAGHRRRSRPICTAATWSATIASSSCSTACSA